MSEHKPIILTDPDAEPAWIRDTSVAIVDIDTRDVEKIPEIVYKICEGEIMHCEWCGAPIAIWPTKTWADHVIVHHGADMTIMARTALSVMCADEINPAQQAYFSVMFGSRVAIRRRAWRLGFAVVKGPAGKPAN